MPGGGRRKEEMVGKTKDPGHLDQVDTPKGPEWAL